MDSLMPFCAGYILLAHPELILFSKTGILCGILSAIFCLLFQVSTTWTCSPKQWSRNDGCSGGVPRWFPAFPSRLPASRPPDIPPATTRPHAASAPTLPASGTACCPSNTLPCSGHSASFWHTMPCNGSSANFTTHTVNLMPTYPTSPCSSVGANFSTFASHLLISQPCSRLHFHGLVQGWSNSIAYALELSMSCPKLWFLLYTKCVYKEACVLAIPHIRSYTVKTSLYLKLT